MDPLVRDPFDSEKHWTGGVASSEVSVPVSLKIKRIRRIGLGRAYAKVVPEKSIILGWEDSSSEMVEHGGSSTFWLAHLQIKSWIRRRSSDNFKVVTQ